MANPEHVAVARRGAAAIDEWRRANPGVQLDLSGAYFGDADLEGADLRAADLEEAHLPRTDLTMADLTGSHLAGAFMFKAILGFSNLTRSDLRRAELTAANLQGADLTGANLAEANLFTANLASTKLKRTNLARATLHSTSFNNVDLTGALGLATVIHQAPSSVGVDTLIASFHGAGGKLTQKLKTFFRGAGVPQELLEALPKIVGKVKHYSCFISYGQPDAAFATKLREDLVAKGVSCWLYEMDKTVGKETWREIEQKLEEYDKMVVVCSIDALMRDGVKKEIDKQIDKNPDKLIPVSLDNRWTHPGFKAQWGSRDLKTYLLDRNYADFAGWESDPNQYHRALSELLRALKRPSA